MNREEVIALIKEVLKGMDIEAEEDQPKELYHASEYPDVKTLVITGETP